MIRPRPFNVTGLLVGAVVQLFKYANNDMMAALVAVGLLAGAQVFCTANFVADEVINDMGYRHAQAQFQMMCAGICGGHLSLKYCSLRQ